LEDFYDNLIHISRFCYRFPGNFMKTHHLSAPGIASIKKFQDRGLAENRRSEIPETTKDGNKKTKPRQPKPENGDKNSIIVG